MIYIDSNIFVIAANKEDERHDKAVLLIELMEEGYIDGCTSVISVDEVVYSVSNLVSDQKAEEIWKDLISEPGLEIIGLDSSKVLDSSKQFPEHDPRDCIHLETFKDSKAEKMVTEDNDFLENEENSIGLEGFLRGFLEESEGLKTSDFSKVMD